MEKAASPEYDMSPPEAKVCGAPSAWPTCNHVVEAGAALLRNTGCNPGVGGCSPMCQRLQVHVTPEECVAYLMGHGAPQLGTVGGDAGGRAAREHIFGARLLRGEHLHPGAVAGGMHRAAG